MTEEKIFLVKGEEKTIDGFEFVKPLGDFVELTKEELELIKIDMFMIMAQMKPKHKKAFEIRKELLKKLEGLK